MKTQKPINFSKIYSPHKLETFDRCPKNYHFSYLDPDYRRMKGELNRKPENIWHFQTLGKAVHNTITLFYHLPSEERTESKLLEKLKEAWRSEAMWGIKPPLGKWGGFEDIESERTAYRKAIQMLKNFSSIAEISPRIKILPTNNLRNSIDDYISLITPITEEVDISGKFDLITELEDKSLHVIDYKTGKRNGFNPFQLRFYKALAELRFGSPVGKIGLYFLENAEIRDIDLQEKPTEEIKKEILEKVEMINATTQFDPKPSKLCKYCLFKTFCPARDEVSEILKDSSDTDNVPSELPF